LGGISSTGRYPTVILFCFRQISQPFFFDGHLTLSPARRAETGSVLSGRFGEKIIIELAVTLLMAALI
jgi:hypothetical protein